jgi:hypothetical protein
MTKPGPTTTEKVINDIRRFLKPRIQNRPKSEEIITAVFDLSRESPLLDMTSDSRETFGRGHNGMVLAGEYADTDNNPNLVLIEIRIKGAI